MAFKGGDTVNKAELLELKNKILSIGKKSDIYELMPNMSAYEYLLNRQKDNLNSVAINYLGRTMTYKELFEKIDNTAKAYSELVISSLVSLFILIIVSLSSLIISSQVKLASFTLVPSGQVL